MAEQMKGITCCVECSCYDLKKHRCLQGCNKETDKKDPFYDDCPLPDVKPVVHAHWEWKIEKTFAGAMMAGHCSNCGNATIVEYPYCSNCGAQMDEEVKDDNRP